MVWTRLRNYRAADRIEAVNALQFPASARHRLMNLYPDLSSDDIRVVEAATRQWFRLIARRPGAEMVMPSVLAAILWQELTRHDRDYAAFCEAAFGRSVPYRPGFVMGADADRHPFLLATFRYARRDEGAGPTALPLLFKVDQSLHIQGGNRYLADCGGRGECFPVPGLTCLHHLEGPGRWQNVRGLRGHSATTNDVHYGPIGGDG